MWVQIDINQFNMLLVITMHTYLLVTDSYQIYDSFEKAALFLIKKLCDRPEMIKVNSSWKIVELIDNQSLHQYHVINLDGLASCVFVNEYGSLKQIESMLIFNELKMLSSMMRNPSNKHNQINPANSRNQINSSSRHDQLNLPNKQVNVNLDLINHVIDNDSLPKRVVPKYEKAREKYNNPEKKEVVELPDIEDMTLSKIDIDRENERAERKRKEKEEEGKRMFIENKRIYREIKKDMADGKIVESNLPEFFIPAYVILDTMENKKIINFNENNDIDNEYKRYQEMYQKFLPETEVVPKTPSVPHKWNYMSLAEKTEYVKQYGMSVDEFEKTIVKNDHEHFDFNPGQIKNGGSLNNGLSVSMPSHTLNNSNDSDDSDDDLDDELPNPPPPAELRQMEEAIYRD